MGRFGMIFLGLILYCCVGGLIQEANAHKYKDPNQRVSVRIRDLLGQMTLAEKIGQMMQIERANASAEVMTKYFIGTVLSAGGSVPSPQATPAEWVKMVNEIQKASLSTRLGIPVLYGIDAVHGNNNVFRATIFPHNVDLGCTGDLGLVKRIGAATALKVRATGIAYAFAPCIAALYIQLVGEIQVCRDPRWGRCHESFSEDTEMVKSMTDSILGLQGDLPDNYPKGTPFIAGKNNVAACAKHYVGDGGTVDGINENDTIIDAHGLYKIHMPHAIEKGVATVMISYSSWNGVKMHTNKKLITNVLKKNLHFRGFVISDFQGIDKITSPPHANYTYSVLESINAGIDMVMVGYTYEEFVHELTQLVESGGIPNRRCSEKDPTSQAHHGSLRGTNVRWELGEATGESRT